MKEGLEKQLQNILTNHADELWFGDNDLDYSVDGALGLEEMIWSWITENFEPKIAGQVEPEVKPDVGSLAQKREYKTVYLLVSTLANMCAGNEDEIINLLTGYLWDEKEAGEIRHSV